MLIFQDEELSAALRQAAEAFNKITALLSEQQELLKSASRSSSPGGVFNSFIIFLKAITLVWNRSTPARIKASTSPIEAAAAAGSGDLAVSSVSRLHLSHMLLQ